MIIAIDGPAASGKGTLGRKLAVHYGFRHLDTGLLYRAVAKALLDAGHAANEEARAIAAAKAIDPARFDEAALKRYEIGEAASVVSAIPGVRAALFNFQREFAAAPNAEVKIFVTASPEVRAGRRASELRGRGETADEKAILSDIIARDERDRSRATAPLAQAPDAHLLDTSALDIDGAFRAALALVERARR
jgi:cytidylate kinase